MYLQESLFQTSPTGRRDSTPLLDKVKLDANLAAKAKASIEADKEEEKPKQPHKLTEDLPIVKYFDTQARTIMH